MRVIFMTAVGDYSASLLAFERRCDRRLLERVPRAGFEPTTPGLGNRKVILAKGEGACTYDETKNCVAVCVALLEYQLPDLSTVVKNWTEVPGPVRTGILAMVRAAANACPRGI